MGVSSLITPATPPSSPRAAPPPQPRSWAAVVAAVAAPPAPPEPPAVAPDPPDGSAAPAEAAAPDAAPAYDPGVPAPAADPPPAAPAAAGVTILQQQPRLAVREAGDLPRQARTRRRGAPTTAVVPSTLPAATRPSPRAAITKGSKHASRCAGPFVAALARMPPAPLQGAKRRQNAHRAPPRVRACARRRGAARRAVGAHGAVRPARARPLGRAARG